MDPVSVRGCAGRTALVRVAVAATAALVIGLTTAGCGMGAAELPTAVSGSTRAIAATAEPGPTTLPTAPGGDWTSFGRDPGGSQHSPLAQIDIGNVGRLQQV